MDHAHHELMLRRPASGHEAALRSVQKPPSKPWRAGGLAPAVEPREFRDLVQRLTGAPAAGLQQHQRAAVVPTLPVAVRVGTGVTGQETVGQMHPAAPWLSFPLVAPAAAMHPGLDGNQLV
ncbi:uncharacterized protein LOC124689109 [Lolium rigidum]|uniref:uncharacterized protein LOC124689109 n=1 Tax=Lolium rigidum TaxID=89674 RepID=UPI001F5D71AE|nr:uncharacterized protein LOC124689109 [Lolium rigidum]